MALLCFSGELTKKREEMLEGKKGVARSPPFLEITITATGTETNDQAAINKEASLHCVNNNYRLGKGNTSKMDEFSEKFQTVPPLIFGISYCGFFIRLYSLKNHTCGIFLKSPGCESNKNDDSWCQIQCLNFKFWGWLGPELKRDGGSAI